MSHSTTHLDVDDVLTSIRRLVSDGPGDRDGEAAADLFVLTPAHRVGKEATATAPVEPDVQDEFLDLSRPPAELHDAPLADETGPQKVDQPDNEHVYFASADTQTAVVDSELVILTDRVTEDEPEDQHVADDSVEPLDSLASNAAEKTLLEQRIAELERAVGKVEDDFEPDGSEPQDIQQPKLHFLQRYRDRFEVIDGDGIDRDAPDPLPDDVSAPSETVAEAPQEPRQPPLNLGEVAVFTHTPRRFAPAPSDLPEEDDAIALQSDGGTDIVDRDDEFFVDEEVLRKLVSDIVRNELQGRLGERITRNVRRMVRHEIEKALSLKSVE